MSSSSAIVPETPDAPVYNAGTLFLLCPLTHRAKTWIDEHVEPDVQWFGSALVVEHRYAHGLAQGLIDAGLVLASSKLTNITVITKERRGQHG